MVDRTVSVKFRVDTGDAEGKINRLSTATGKFGKAGESLRTQRADWDNIAKAAGGAGLAIGAGLAVATKSYMDFEQAMSGVKSVSGATADEFEQLKQQAIDMGAATAFSASEAATAQEELAKAGLTAAEILGGGLQGALSLAAAGGLELGTAAEIAATSMNMFGLEAKDVGRVADVLANGANKSATDVHQLGQGLSQVGTIASQTGLSLEDTVSALSLFADAGIKGSDAGTSLKTMLQRLTPQSKEAQQVFDELGFSAYDAQGNFIGLEALAGELQESFGGLDTEARNSALGVAFGADAIRGASILMQGGEQAVRDYTEAMSEQGTAAEVAATRMDNLAGDIEELSGSLETAFIGAGSVGNDALRGLVQDLTGVVNKFSELPGPMQEFIVKGAAVTSGALLIGGAGIKAATGLMDLWSSAKNLAPALDGVKSAGSGVVRMLTGPWGAAFAAGVAVVGLWIDAKQKAKQRTDDYIASLDAETGAITEQTRELQANELQRSGVADAYAKMGGNIADLVPAINGEADAQERVNAVLDAKLAAMIESGHATDEYGTSVDVVRQKLGGMREELDEAASSQQALEVMTGAAKERILEQSDAAFAAGEQLGFAASATDELTEATHGLTEAELASAEAAIAQAEAIRGVIDAAYAAIDADIAYEAALDSLTETVKENGRTHDISTEAGRKNVSALTDLAEAAYRNAEAQLTNGASLDEVNASMRSARDSFVRGAEQMGYTTSEANALADQLGLTRGSVSALDTEISGLDGKTVTVEAVGPAASKQAVMDLGWQIGALRDRTVTVTTRYVTIGNPANAGGAARTLRSYQAEGSVLDFYAAGGLRESHVAQIAPAGAWRVWAEPETGGEAYIPLSEAKRPRSWAILEEVADRFGADLVKRYAGGGFFSSPAPVYSPPVQPRASSTAAPSGPVDLSRSDLDYLAAAIGRRFDAATSNAEHTRRRLARAEGKA